MKLTVTVLHNVGQDMFHRFRPDTSSLHHAHTFEVVADSVDDAANLIWNLTNVGDAEELRVMFPHLSEYAGQVTDYRARLNRSLSVADVLVFHELLRDEEPRIAGGLAVAAVGFELIELPVDFTDGSNDSAFSESYRAIERYRERG